MSTGVGRACGLFCEVDSTWLRALKKEDMEGRRVRLVGASFILCSTGGVSCVLWGSGRGEAPS